VTTSDGYGRRQVRAVLAGLMLATFVASLDMTVVAAALYRIGMSLNGQAWVTTAFMIASTVSVPVYGKLSDTHGRKPLFVIAIAVFLAGFLLAERRAGDSALLTLRLFRNHGFAVGAGQSLVSATGIFASIVLLPLYLQLVRGYSPTEAGLLTLPQVAGTLAFSVLAGQFTSRTGRYKVLPVTGSVLLLAGMLMLWPLTAATPLLYTEIVLFLLGAGSSLYRQTITLSMQNALPQADLGVATSSNTFFFQIGSTAGAAAFLSIAYSTAGGAIRTAYAAASTAPAFRTAVARHPGQAGLLHLAASGSQPALNNTGFLARLSPVLAQPFKQGFTSALDTAFLAAAAVMAAALVLAVAIRELPLRTTIAASAAPAAPAEPAEPAEPARQ
jgi:MFS family permease